jgi:hypothetical protein
MDDTITSSASANDNRDPFLRPDTALDELCPLRRAVLAKDTSGYTLEQWRERRRVLTKLNNAINTCLRNL